jgi:hypothetical protein
VKALDRAITLSEFRIPLGELVEKVAAETGVSLTTTPEVADEPLVVAVKQLPARELLEQVAELLDFMWSRRGKEGEWRYEIWQDLASKNREEALRQASAAAAEQRLAEEIRRFAEAASLPTPRLQALARQNEQWLERFFKLPPAQREAVRQKEWKQMEPARLAARLGSPVGRALAAHMGRLAPADWAVLRQGQPLFLSSDPRPGERLLPPEMASTFRAARPVMDDGWRYGNTEHAEQERQKQREMETEWAQAGGFRVALWLDTRQFRKQGYLGLSAHARPIDTRPDRYEGYRHADGTSLHLSGAPVEPKPQAVERTEGEREKLASDPLLGARKKFRVAPGPRPDPTMGPDNWRFIAELLPDLARSCEINVIGHSYASDRSGIAIPTAEPTPLYELLDQIAGDRYHWDRKGPLIRFSYRTWFYARPKEVPHRLVRHWRALLKQHDNLPFEECAAAAALLNDDQLQFLSTLLHREGVHTFHEFYMARHGLRLYASLSPQQQAALWRGEAYPFGVMTPAQREWFLAPLHARQQERFPDLDAPGEVPPDVAPRPGPDSRFALTTSRWIVTIEPHGNGGARFHWNPDPGPAAATGRPAAASAPPSAPARPARPAPARAAAARAGKPATRPSPVTRRPLLRVAFEFRYTPEQQAVEQLHVAPPAPSPATANPEEAHP